MADKMASALPSSHLGKMKRKVMFIYTRFPTYIREFSFLVFRFKNCVFTLTLYFRQGKSYKSMPAKYEYQENVHAKQ